MPVYVDNAQSRYGRMIMCHMLADTTDELLEMADTIGVDRRHFQHDGSTPHFDICKAKRRLAIANGAIEVSRRELVHIIRRLRVERGFAVSEPTDLNQYRERRAASDISPDLTYVDDDGIPWYQYAVEYTDARGARMEVTLWATSFEDAEQRLTAMRDTGSVVGVLCAEIPS